MKPVASSIAISAQIFFLHAVMLEFVSTIFRVGFFLFLTLFISSQNLYKKKIEKQEIP